MLKNDCVEKMKKLHSTSKETPTKCDILYENLMRFCERYNSDSNKANCDSVNSFGGITLNLTTKSPT